MARNTIVRPGWRPPPPLPHFQWLLIRKMASWDWLQLSNSQREALKMSLCFTTIFMAFSAAQNFATSRGAIGANTLGILYITFTFANIPASFVVNRVGPPRMLVAGGVTYVTYVLANIPYTAATMYTAAVLLGAGAAHLWTAQGAYITRCSRSHEYSNGLPERSTLGQFSGSFWAIFQCNQLLGNLIVALLFSFDINEQVIFTAMSCIASCGIVGLLTLAPLGDLPVSTVEDSVDVVKTSDETNTAPSAASVASKFWDTLGIIPHRHMRFLVPLMIYSGMSQTFIFGTFPQLITTKSTKFFVMATFGGADAVSSALFGHLSDSVQIRRIHIFLLGAVLHSFVYVYIAVVDTSVPKAMFFVLALVFALGDGIFNTQIMAVLGAFFPNRSEAAFAALKLFQASTTSAAFFYNDHISLRAKLVLLLVTLACGLVVVLWSGISVDVGASSPEAESDAESGRKGLLDSVEPSAFGEDRDQNVMMQPIEPSGEAGGYAELPLDKPV